ncbi:MAG: ATP-dependent 6-phosphofructokinase, partial [Lentisphaerae bacterium]
MDWLERQILEHPEQFDFRIKQLGSCQIPTPIRNRNFVSDDEKVLFSANVEFITQCRERSLPDFCYEKAGPRAKLFHDPAWTRAAIVTCGGLCPGLNDVIKGLVNTLALEYGVKTIYGIRYGYRGLIPDYHYSPLLLDPDTVDRIHEDGGSILGSSRGNQDVGAICDTLQRLGINILFTVGGDGTHRGAHAIVEELTRRRQQVSVIGVPKTIDNDLCFVGRSFGFETSIYSTTEVLTAAHNEAKGAPNGISVVKLMGRDSGFIASYASLAHSVVNFCLIPEIPFTLEGPNGLLTGLERRFAAGKDHAVIVVAEGAGQDLFENTEKKVDASGNEQKQDIGTFLADQIKAYAKKQGYDWTVKYFDPSYLIRSLPAFGTDAVYCLELAIAAVHAAMAGKTDMV